MPAEPLDAAALQPTLRQPAPEIGPRAQRTIDSILDATREVFVEKGYGGTSIDDITTRAGVSRASFYTYFPTKRDALLALGSGATLAARQAIEGLDDLPDEPTVTDIEAWLRTSLGFLERFGAFGLAWSQASDDEPELRNAGMHTHLRTCAMLGSRLNRLRGATLADDTELGLVVMSMLERTWNHRSIYSDTINSDAVLSTTAAVIDALLRR